MALQSVYIEKDDENEAPPSRVLKASFFPGGYTTADEYMQPVIYLAIGDFQESTYEDSFQSSEDRQFSVGLIDLANALGALGVFKRLEVAEGVVLDDAV